MALKWKEAFDENLIDLMYEEKRLTILEEPMPEYTDLRDELIQTQRRLLARKAALVKCMQEKEELYQLIIKNGIKE